MTTGTQFDAELPPDGEAHDGPDIALCESCPGRSVFLESGNTNGWIASNLNVDVTR